MGVAARREVSFAYWARWVAVLPGAIIAGALATFPLHWVLYSTLTGSGIVEPYPQWPERVLTPLAFAIGFIWGGARIAPARRMETAIALFGVHMAILGAMLIMGLTGASFMGRPMGLPHGPLAPIGSCVGTVIGLLIVRAEQKARRQSPDAPEQSN